MKKVCVVGAGASGLPAIRVCLEYGYDVVCFEKSVEIGGIWRYKQEDIDGEGCVMKSTVINTSKEMTAYSDYPPPSDFANFMHNSQMQRYFKMYAEHHGLIKYIKFNHCVTDVSRASDHDKSGKWTVNYRNEHDQEQTETFDGVMLASGHHVHPYSPKPWPSQEKFKGRILHSHSYKDHRGYEDQRVVVVGVGNSGGDIAVELSRISAQVYLVTRRGTWVINRIFDYGHPVDMSLNNRFVASVRPLLPTSFQNWVFERKLEARFDHAKYGLKPAHRVFSAHPTINDELPNRIACGMVIVKPNIANFTETGVVFEDGSLVDKIDTVVLATGYKFSFPYAEGGRLIPVQDNKVNLYLYMYPPQLAKKNSLAVLGLIQPLGSIMPISEMQARVFCDVLGGHSKLPDEQGMMANITAKRTELAERYVQTRRHTIQVDYMPFMDELADIIGAKPDILSVFKSDPMFGLKLLFGPNVPYQYRVNGPHAWPAARDAIMNVNERVEAATRTRITPETSPTQSHFWIYILIGLVIAWFCLWF